jgi:hypothetical protein
MNDRSPYALLALEQKVAQLEKELRDKDARDRQLFDRLRNIVDDAILKMNYLDEVTTILEEKVYPNSSPVYDAIYKIIKGHSKRTSHLDVRRVPKERGLPRKSD